MSRKKIKRMTVKVIESLPGPPDGAKTSNIEYSVPQQQNLCLAVYKNGSRSWRFKQKFRGERLFITIGAFPLWSLDQAIEKVRFFKRQMADGIDPRVADASQSTISFRDFVQDEFLPYAEQHYKSFSNQKNMLENRILNEFRATVLSEITKRQIAQFHKRVCDDVSGTTGNRHLSLLSSIFRYAIELDLIEKNPCVGVKKARENKSRDRFLKEDEYVRFIKVLNTMLDNPQAQAIFLLIALGQRKTSILSLSWHDVSLADKHIYLRETKNGDSQYVALNSVSVDLLTEMYKDRDKTSEWVFPSNSASGHLQDVRKTFSTICKRAEISGLRLHDLRRSMATHLLKDGVDIVTIKELLGHRSLKSTQVYARVATSSLAKSSELAAVKIQKALNQ